MLDKRECPEDLRRVPRDVLVHRRHAEGVPVALTHMVHFLRIHG